MKQEPKLHQEPIQEILKFPETHYTPFAGNVVHKPIDHLIVIRTDDGGFVEFDEKQLASLMNQLDNLKKKIK